MRAPRLIFSCEGLVEVRVELRERRELAIRAMSRGSLPAMFFMVKSAPNHRRATPRYRRSRRADTRVEQVGF